MEFIADLHLHSRYSRATSRDLNLESLYVAAQCKGIQVLATGDATHPAWFAELKERLVPAEPGFYRLRDEVAKVCDLSVPERCRGPVRFVLGTEISNIYKKDGYTRKNHNLVFLPDFASAERFNERLAKIGNIHSDGRPILGLDARDLLEIVLETDPLAYLVPAHIWTPWFSMLGSKSGFDSLEQCFGDLSAHIFAAETGLSSDPPMNWRVSGLDGLTLISNSDAHSAAKLGREANRFDTEFSFAGIRQALEHRENGSFLGTIEFFPQEGKYHLDGHRSCAVRLTPAETRRCNGICPVCHRPLTLGVLHRIDYLADRPEGVRAPKAAPFCNLLPLCDLLGEVLHCGAASKKIDSAQQQALQRLGSELDILMKLDRQTIAGADIPLLDEAVERMRRGQVEIDGGYDGAYGRIRIFAAGERRRILGQQTLFCVPPPERLVEANACASIAPPAQRTLFESRAPASEDADPDCANEAQREAVEATDAALVIVAGPGTGKTFTLTRRIARLICVDKVPAESILAVTFTRKAAESMRRRIGQQLGPDAPMPEIGTFHGICAKFLPLLQPEAFAAIIDEDQRLLLISEAVSRAAGPQGRRPFSVRRASAFIEAVKQAPQPQAPPVPEADGTERILLEKVFDAYQQMLAVDGLCDFDDLILRTTALLESADAPGQGLRERFRHVFVDEFQDINAAQYRLLRALLTPAASLCAIGDPDQSIYGFRGSDPGLMARLQHDYPGARTIRLDRSYRSPQLLLAAAAQVISAGSPEGCRVPLKSHRGGPAVAVVRVESEKAEAVAIGRIIERMVGGSGFETVNFGALEGSRDAFERSFADFAILFRTHVQGRILAEVLEGAGIPCQFASRRLLMEDPAVAALAALTRVIAGRGSLVDLEPAMAWLLEAPAASVVRDFKKWCYRHRFSLRQGLTQAVRIPVEAMTVARQRRLVAAIERIKTLQKESDGLAFSEKIAYLIKKTKCCQRLEPMPEPLERLIGSCADETEFLVRLSLTTDTDIYDERAERVTLMSLHAAKGLEFEVVFIAGCEDGLIPLRQPGRTTDLAEERRLFYVGMTRAREALYLCSAGRRCVREKMLAQIPSPFLADIDAALKVEEIPPRPVPKKPRQTQMRLF